MQNFLKRFLLQVLIPPPEKAGKRSSYENVLSNKSQIDAESPRPLQEAAKASLDKPIDSDPTDPEHANPQLEKSRKDSQLIHLASESAHFFFQKNEH